MSVYRDTTASVVFEHPHAGPLTAVVYREGAILPVYTPVEPIPSTSGKFVLDIPWQATEFDGNLTVVWSAEGFVRRQAVEVVTPIVPLSRLSTVFLDAGVQEGDLEELESIVRAVITTYTGQSFGYYGEQSRVVRATGSERILLDDRLISLTSFAGVLPGAVRIGVDGYSLVISPDRELRIKQAPPEEFIGQGGVIRLPDWYVKNFTKDATYVVTGEWGYDNVPAEVQEAALLLANDYLTGDSGYRDRYLSILKIQQDSFTYNAGAYRGTGNARADLLLGPFRRKTGMIIL